MLSCLVLALYLRNADKFSDRSLIRPSHRLAVALVTSEDFCLLDAITLAFLVELIAAIPALSLAYGEFLC